jgi:hypothetical protein
VPLIEIAASFLLKTAKDSLHDWAKKEGVSIIDGLVANEGFSLFGKRKAAISRLWESVSRQVEQPALVAAINLEANEYLRLPGLLCDNSDNLPEESGSYPLSALKALPRCAINDAAMTRLKNGIGKAQLLRDSKADSDTLVAYFIGDVVREFDKQYRKSYEDKTPLKVGELRDTAGNWTVIALDSVYPWPPSETSGHYLIYHQKLAEVKKLDRDEKKKIEDQMSRLEARLGNLDSTTKEKMTNNITFRTDSKFSAQTVPWKIA